MALRPWVADSGEKQLERPPPPRILGSYVGPQDSGSEKNTPSRRSLAFKTRGWKAMGGECYPGSLSPLGLLGKTYCCAIVSPIYRNGESHPRKVSGDNFLELRGVNRENQAGPGWGPEKCQVCGRKVAGRGAGGLPWLMAWWLGASVCDFTFWEVSFWSKCGWLVALVEEPRPGGEAGKPREIPEDPWRFLARGSQCRESWSISRWQGPPHRWRRFWRGQF